MRLAALNYRREVSASANGGNNRDFRTRGNAARQTSGISNVLVVDENVDMARASGLARW